jgi:hypothetical protein
LSAPTSVVAPLNGPTTLAVGCATVNAPAEATLPVSVVSSRNAFPANVAVTRPALNVPVT